jgi:hypothetical protein
MTSIDNSISNSFVTDLRGSSQIYSNKKSVESVARFLRCASGKRQQRNIAGLLDCRGQAPLVRSADATEPARHDPPTFRHELGEQSDVFVIDCFNLFHAELANLLAPEIFSPARSTFSTAAWSAPTRWTTLAAIRPVATATAKRR